jgi:hypothetical protein
MSITLTKEQAFWAQLDLANKNFRLYKTWVDWQHFLDVTPWWELSAGLVHYFGCSLRTEGLWVDWKQAVDMKFEPEIVQLRLEAAIKETWVEESGMPERFKHFMQDEYWSEPCQTY